MQVSWNDIKNKQSLWNYWAWYYLKTYWWWSWDIKITCGFTPKTVYIFASYKNWFNAISESYTTIDNNWNLTTSTHYQVYSSWDRLSKSTWSSSSIQCVYVYRDSTRRQELYMKSFDADGFTMEHWYNWTNDAYLHFLVIW